MKFLMGFKFVIVEQVISMCMEKPLNIVKTNPGYIAKLHWRLTSFTLLYNLHCTYLEGK